MSDNATMLCAVLGGVLLIAALFIRRARKYKQRMNRPLAKGVPFEKISATPKTGMAAYYLYFLCPVRLPSKERRRVNIRSEYYDKITRIISSTQDSQITISGYLDNVLRGHFHDFENEVRRLLEDHAGNPSNTSEQ